jgi:aryl-alcohol dehydrogenase-like predicted oxidoreductase
MTILAKRPFSPAGPRVSPLGLSGSYGIDADSVERAFHELGVNYFFITSKNDGVLEGLRRLIKAGHRSELVIAGGASVPTGFGVRGAIEKDLKRLGTDYIDVFQIFWVQYHWYVTGNTWPAMRKLKEEGRAKMLGISIHDRKMASTLVKELALDMLMIRYNAAHRGAESEIFSTFEATRPAVVAYTATRWGKLLEPAAKLGPMTPEECYRFALSNENVDVVLCGPKNYAELEENARGVAKGPLPQERIAEVRAFGDVVRRTAVSSIAFGT